VIGSIGQQTVLVVSKEKSKDLIRMDVDFRQPREATFCFWDLVQQLLVLIGFWLNGSSYF